MGEDDADEADLGWGRWVRGALHVHDVEAHHCSILRQPAVGWVAALVSAFLAGTTQPL